MSQTTTCGMCGVQSINGPTTIQHVQGCPNAPRRAASSWSAVRSPDQPSGGTLSEEAGLRRLLFLSHPCSCKYSDDGELQCVECRIDFRRDSVEHIDLKLIARGMKLLDAARSHPGEQSAPASECAQCGDDGPLQRCPSCGNDLCSTCSADPCDRASSSCVDAEAAVAPSSAGDESGEHMLLEYRAACEECVRSGGTGNIAWRDELHADLLARLRARDAGQGALSGGSVTACKHGYVNPCSICTQSADASPDVSLPEGFDASTLYEPHELAPPAASEGGMEPSERQIRALDRAKQPRAASLGKPEETPGECQLARAEGRCCGQPDGCQYFWPSPSSARDA